MRHYILILLLILPFTIRAQSVEYRVFVQDNFYDAYLDTGGLLCDDTPNTRRVRRPNARILSATSTLLARESNTENGWEANFTFDERPLQMVGSAGECSTRLSSGGSVTSFLGSYAIGIPNDADAFYGEQDGPTYIYMEKIDPEEELDNGVNCSTLTINAPRGLDGQFIEQWQYSFGDVVAANISNSAGRSRIPFNFDDFSIDPNEDVGKTINFRYRVRGGHFSPFRGYTIQLCPLALRTITRMNSECSYDNGSVSLTFNRLLADDERVNVFLTRVESDGREISVEDIRNVAFSGNVYTLPSLVAPGTYFINTQSQIGTVLTPLQRSQNFTITAPPPISFSATKGNDIFCNGGRDGRINISASGGVGDYEFRLNNGGWSAFANATTHTISGLREGTYTIRVRDRLMCTERLANGSDKAVSITINEPTPIQLTTVSLNDPSAFGENDGSIVVNITGGTPASNGSYTVQWRNNANFLLTTTVNRRIGSNYRTTLNTVGDGNYTLTVTDNAFASASTASNSSCRSQNSYTLTEPPELIASVRSIEEIICNGGTGNLEANIQGEILGASYSYRWFRVSGSTDVLLPQTSRVISGLSAGIYKVEVTDGDGNSDVSSNFNFTEPEPLTFTSFPADILCYDGNDGEIIIVPSGGTPPYFYTWLDGSTQRNRFNLISGTYFLKITDDNGCEIDNFDTGFRLEQPAAPVEITTDILQNITFRGGNDGRISISAVGGTPPYSYRWQKQGIPGTFAFTKDISNLTEGVYTVTVRDDNEEITGNTNGTCQTTQVYTITEPEELVVAITENPISCFNAADATLTANVTGGVPILNTGYSYEWFRSNGGRFVSIGQTTMTATGLDVGTFRVIITDANGTQAEDTITITQPTELGISFTKQDVFCNGGANGRITLTASGGTTDYTYTWRNSRGELIATTKDIANLAADTYSLTLSDARNCIRTQDVEITEPEDAIQITVDRIDNPTAFQATDGSIAIRVVGGTGPYTYEWRDNQNTIIRTTKDIMALGAGAYTLTVRDANFSRTSNNTGCTALETVTLTEPELLTVEISGANGISCFEDANGALQANALGGVAPYSYEWFVIENNTTTRLDLTEPLITNLATGRYRVRITDANAITVTDDFNLLEPEVLRIAETTVEDVLCFGAETGGIDIAVTGGTAPYTYFWSTSARTQDISGLSVGSYNVVVTDANNCEVRQDNIMVSQPDAVLEIEDVNITNLRGFETNDGAITVNAIGGTAPYRYSWIATGTTSVLSTERTISGLAAGNYELTITDANGCEFIQDYEVTQPDQLLVSITQTLFNLCFNDATATLQANATGGTSPYTYRWYNLNAIETTLSTAINLENSAAGMYGLTITDANNIEVTSQFTVDHPEAIAVSFTVTDVSCFGAETGAIDISVTGGTGTYTYLWSNREITEDVSRLAAGIYTVRVTDENNCSAETTVTVTQPERYDVTNATLIRPSGATVDGRITITITGGIAPYTYRWLDSSRNVLEETIDSPLNTNTISNIATGTYTVTITDSIGCVHEEIYNLGNPGQLITNITQAQPVSCHGASDGQLIANSIGGSGGNTFIWFDANSNTVIGENSAFLANIPAGSYYVVVRDANGLQEQSAIFTLTEPDILTASLTGDYINCGTDNDWTISTQVTGGTPPYTYSWNTGDTTTNLTNAQPGNYLVRIIDAFGCETLGTYKVNVPEALAIQGNTTQVECAEACEGEIDLLITGGRAPYLINWNTGAVSTTLNGLCPGIYTVTVTDQLGCEMVADFSIENPSEVSVDLGEDRTLCNGQSLDLDITTEVSGDSYRWTSNTGFTSTAPKVTLTEAGIYTATVTTASGCVGTDDIEITTSQIGISSQFLITTQAFAKEDIILINTSNPLSENIQWFLPNEAQIISQDEETITLRFDIPGAYEIALRAFEGNCFEDFRKPIIVGEARVLPDVGDANTPFIKEFKTYPNPSTGVFEVDVELQEEATISLRMYSLDSNTAVDDRQAENASTYTINYNLRLASGTYFLLLETSKGSEIRKIVMQ